VVFEHFYEHYIALESTVYCYGKSDCLSDSYAYGLIAVIDSLFESLFHLTLEEVSLINIGQPCRHS
jgi:hypothetical protein